MFFTLTKALRTTRKLNRDKISGSISFLPVITSRESVVFRCVENYKSALDAIAQGNLDSDITIKLPQFGLLDNRALAEKAIEEVVSYAKAQNNFVWIDQERPSLVDATIEIFESMHQKYANVGICLQAYLKRTEKDLNRILQVPVPIRLVKGFYKWNDFKTWREVTENYSHLMDLVLSKSSRPCIATHDLALLKKAQAVITQNNLTNAEIQMFIGTRSKLAASLAKAGFKIRVYVFYGYLFGYFYTGFRTFDNIRNFERLLHFKVIH